MHASLRPCVPASDVAEVGGHRFNCSRYGHFTQKCRDPVTWEAREELDAFLKMDYDERRVYLEKRGQKPVKSMTCLAVGPHVAFVSVESQPPPEPASHPEGALGGRVTTGHVKFEGSSLVNTPPELCYPPIASPFPIVSSAHPLNNPQIDPSVTSIVHLEGARGGRMIVTLFL